MSAALAITVPAERPVLTWKRHGRVVVVSDGVDTATLTCRSAGLAREVERSLAFWLDAQPTWSGGEVLRRALDDVEAARAFRAHRRRIPQFRGGIRC